jgi:tetratricopeptide (TPR) repeat protein
MGVVSILFSSFALCARRSRYSIIFGIAAVLGWLGTLQSLERAPFIATSIGLTIVVSTSLLTLRRYRVTALLGAILLGAFLIQLIPVKQMAPEDASTVGRIKAAAVAGDSSAQARFLLWGIALEMLRSHPLTGVGGSNYQANYADARAQFAQRHPQSALVSFNEHLIPIFAHNEYVQIIAELGAVGFILFVLFAFSFILNAIESIRIVKRKLTVIGPAAALLAFAVSSGASASSFRYLSGGLLFFFAAALITRNVSKSRLIVAVSAESPDVLKRQRLVFAGGAALVFLGITFFSLQAIGITFQAFAESTQDVSSREGYYRDAFKFYPGNTSAHFSYGMWLYGQRRASEAVPHMRRAMLAGLNSSICFQYLASVEEAAGDLNAAEQTLAKAVNVYPRSVFLLVRHSVALERVNKDSEAETEFSRAISIDAPAAKGWRNLIVKDIDAALTAAHDDSEVAGPAELGPEAAVLAVLQENEIKNPALAKYGWRQRMRTAASQLK